MWKITVFFIPPCLLNMEISTFSFYFYFEPFPKGHSPETHPELYTQHCWDVENRGCVGETVFHVCFLQVTVNILRMTENSSVKSSFLDAVASQVLVPVTH